MRVALCLFGFIRKSSYIDQVKNSIQRLLPPNSIVDLFYSIPQFMNEFDTQELDQQQCSKSLSGVVNGEKTISYRAYDPHKYMTDSIKIGAPFKTERAQPLYPFRILSMYDAIVQTINLLNNSGKKYDFAILTRLDILPSIETLGDVDYTKRDVLYAWRRCPYVRDTDLEDRCIFGSQKALAIFGSLYDHFMALHYPPDYEWRAEPMLAEFVRSQNGITALPQTRIILGLSPTAVDKYTDETALHCAKILEATTRRR